MSKHKKTILLIIVIGLFLFAQSAYALEILPTPTGGCPGDTADVKYCDAATGKCGEGSPGYGLECNYSLADFIEVFVNISKIILGILGAVALLFFVYGGITWLISGGSPDKIKKGKDILVGTVIGLVLVLGSYAIISFVQDAIGLRPEYRLPEAPAVPGPVVTEPKGCCIFYAATLDKYGTDRLMTSAECDTFISDYTSPGTIERADWFIAADAFMCRIRVSELNMRLHLPGAGCCVPRYVEDTVPVTCRPANSETECPPWSDYEYYAGHECYTMSSCDIRWCLFEGECEQGTVVTCMHRGGCFYPSP